MYQPEQFAEKYQLAVRSAIETQPQGGLCGSELEWNLLDENFRPLLTVGSGPQQQSFVDYLRAECLSPWAREFSQLEVFHWMIEWATRPYYQPRGAVYEARLMEAALLNALGEAGSQFETRLYIWPGNLPIQTHVDHDSIPGSWHLAKRLYLERCVDLYGDSLATAGTHTNLSLPVPLLAWDFMHLSPSERGDRHLDEYKSEFYITATRLMRAFAALFIATSAATPFQAQVRDGRPVVLLSEFDSVRNLTFPNPPELDLPDLYRSYEDYLRLSYDLVRRGVRFGNNNWTPVRARSFAEPVERLIAVTSEQLQALYARGLYALGQEPPLDTMAHQIEIQNLMARINLPMARVEIRTDDGGHPLEVDIANLTLKHLLLARFYADPDFGRAFRYDREDITRARRNEEKAAREGLRAEIEHPLTGKPVGMRDFLRWTLAELRPLAEALGLWTDVNPLVEMAAGAPNTAERLRTQLRPRLLDGEVPLEVLRELAQSREQEVQKNVEQIAGTFSTLEGDGGRLGEFLYRAREDAYLHPQGPVRFQPRSETLVEMVSTDKTGEILSLAQQLIRIPSVTASPVERLEEVNRAAVWIYDYLNNHRVPVRLFNGHKYPALVAGFPGSEQRPAMQALGIQAPAMLAPVMLAGHFDVVEPEPDDGQFEPRIEGDYLWGRGAADMKTVVATYLVWLKDAFRKGSPYPPVNLLLVGNEENGEGEPMGTPFVMQELGRLWQSGGKPYAPSLFIAGERTGERGDELWGEICTQNRGVLRFQVIARGARMHSSQPAGSQQTGKTEIADRIFQARQSLQAVFDRRLTLSSPDGWQSQARFPFVQVGQTGVYNITPDHGVLGVEVRPIPGEDLDGLKQELDEYCVREGLELEMGMREAGVACEPDNPYLVALIQAVRTTSGIEPTLGRKLPGTSARFAPGGQGVVWGQSGMGPHARDERHFIPSIHPYYQALDEFARQLLLRA